MIRAVVAYRSGSHRSRLKPFGLVGQMFTTLGWPITVADDVLGTMFNVGRAKNTGVRFSPGPPDDVLVLADADCVTAAATLHEAVWLASQAPGLVCCGDTIRILNQPATERLRVWQEALHSTAGEVRPCDHTPQLLAVRRDCFDALGGYDEAYEGYGWEDYDFRYRAERMFGPARTATGLLVHLWHEPEEEKVREGPLYQANLRRWLHVSGNDPHAPWAVPPSVARAAMS